MAFKVEISQDFDTWDWEFLFQVLKHFFNNKFCSWNTLVLNSTNLSVSLNGKAVGFFSCSKWSDKVIHCVPFYFAFLRKFLAYLFLILFNKICMVYLSQHMLYMLMM